MKARPKLIIFDLDGVIFRGQYLLRLSWSLGLRQYIRSVIPCLLFDVGRLNIETLLKKVYEGFKGVSLERVWQVYKEMPIVENAQKAVEELRGRGYHVVIISSGVPDFLVKDVAKRLGASLGLGIEAGVLGGALTGEIGGLLSTPDGKDVLATRLLEEKGLGWEDVVVIADDPNNLSIMEKAGLSIGFNATYLVRKKARHIVDGGDLRAVVDLIEEGYRAVDIWEDWLQEARRKLVHVFAGAVPFVADIAFVPTVMSLCLMIVLYTISEVVRLNGRVIPLLGSITMACLRGEERRHFVAGPITLALGVIMSLIFFPARVAVVAILVLAFADTAATLVGRVYGTYRIPYNPSKSIQGSLAGFLVACLCSSLYYPLITALIIALASSVIESLPLRDDNVSIPIGTGLTIMGLTG